ncbi:MAG: acyltransferase family protein [Muribaculaceae bacterium]|nr:acyltransferase family protein [Muribaculaceae bacterium]
MPEARNTTNSSKPVSRAVRDSNMELLRIMAMVLVMVVHANFRALPVPGATAIATSPTSAWLQFLTEGLSIVSVNLFVLLSGWYGIRPKVHRFAELLFQVLFFTLIGVGVSELLVPGSAVGAPDFWKRFFMLGDGHYWFVKTYIALYLLAPVLNAYVESASRRGFAWLLAAFFTFQFIFGWLWEAVTWFKAGYSLTSFMGLYLLARYIRLYPTRIWRMSRWCDLAIYLAVALVLAVAMFHIKRNSGLGGFLYFYNCPLVILSAVHLMLFFSKLSFKSRLVNWLAISAFAIYLTHSGTFLWTYYDDAIRLWFAGESRFTFILYAAAMMAAVFVVSILLDKMRLLMWKPIERVMISCRHGKLS